MLFQCSYENGHETPHGEEVYLCVLIWLLFNLYVFVIEME